MIDIEDFIAARLAEDEQTARAATELPSVTPKYPAKRPPWEPERWRADGADVITENGASDPIQGGYDGASARSQAVANLIVRHDPAHALRQCAAIRRMVAALVGHREGDQQWDRGINAAVASAAAIWRDHPDYNPEWERQ